MDKESKLLLKKGAFYFFLGFTLSWMVLSLPVMAVPLINFLKGLTTAQAWAIGCLLASFVVIGVQYMIYKRTR